MQAAVVSQAFLYVCNSTCSTTCSIRHQLQLSVSHNSQQPQPVHSSTYEHGAGTVEDITCSELFFARLQEVSSLHRLADWRNTLEYREDSPDGDIDVDVRRA